MKNAISPATPSAATIGTARMSGVPRIPESTSDRIVVGSRVAADTCKDDVVAIGDDAVAASPKESNTTEFIRSCVLEPSAAVLMERKLGIIVRLVQKASHPHNVQTTNTKSANKLFRR